MPLFGHKQQESVIEQRRSSGLFGHKEPVQPVTEERKSGLFGHKSHPTTTANTTSKHSTFGSKKSTSISPQRKSGGFLHRHEDSSITEAKARVATAEAREKEADRALMHARVAVKEAREHIRHLEKEATEQARLAKIKQHEAKSLSKKGHSLGRHDHI